MGLSATDKAPGQILDLPIDREVSTIPRPKLGDATDEDHAGKWEYPSPQQFYNALVRKGQETPEESIEMVVAIHNFLNEQAWEEVMKWEKRLPGYVLFPFIEWRHSSWILCAGSLARCHHL